MPSAVEVVGSAEVVREVAAVLTERRAGRSSATR